MEKYKFLELMTEEQRKFHEEFHNCKTYEEVEALMEREQKLNESCKNNDIPHLDMTYEEFLKKYDCVDYEEYRKKHGI